MSGRRAIHWINWRLITRLQHFNTYPSAARFLQRNQSRISVINARLAASPPRLRAHWAATHPCLRYVRDDSYSLMFELRKQFRCKSAVLSKDNNNTPGSTPPRFLCKLKPQPVASRPTPGGAPMQSQLRFLQHPAGPCVGDP